MALNGVFGSGLSALQAAQSGMRVVSQNISNVNTPGYARADVMLEANAAIGGVSVAGVSRAADKFLTAAALTASAQQGSAGVLSELLDRAQNAFGDPTSNASLFASFDGIFTRFTELASDPANGLRRFNAVSATGSFLSRMSDLATQLGALRLEADQRLGDEVSRVNDLMAQIATINRQIATLKGNGTDTSTVESAQAQVLNQLSSYLDLRTTKREDGGLDVRTTAGALLVSDVAVTLQHTPLDDVYASTPGLSFLDRNGASHALGGQVWSGSLAGLTQARDVDLPHLQAALGQLASSAADALNAAHNDNTTVPAPISLTGRQTGLLGADLIGFTGAATIAVADTSGNLVRTVDVDFTSRTYSVNGGGAVSYGGAGTTIAQFVTAMNTALGGNATMSFSAAGAMSLTGAGTNGVLVQQDAAAPSSHGGRGFGHFFGLNDLVSHNTPAFFETGLTSAAAHGLTGGALSVRVIDSNGREVLSRSVAATGTTWADMLTALNAPGSGLSPYGAFAMDANGAIAPTMAAGYRIEVTGDTTLRGTTGLSMSDLFGLTRQASAGRASGLYVRTDIAAAPDILSIARPDLSLAIGQRVLEVGDGRGAAALAAAGNVTRTFPAAGSMAAQTTSLANYVTRLGGQAGAKAEDAAADKSTATAILTAANERRSSIEGVQLDEELVKMTQFQQSYAAASRLIQAARDMYDILMSLSNR